jgi:two-component system cell cycle sensor histidine kinase/response regulator CckA
MHPQVRTRQGLELLFQDTADRLPFWDNTTRNALRFVEALTRNAESVPIEEGAVQDMREGRSTPVPTLELSVLFVGSKEEDFYIIRDVLGQCDSNIHANLEQAFSVAEASNKIDENTYDVVLFVDDSGSALEHEFASLTKKLRDIPLLVLESEDANPSAMAHIIEAGASDWLLKSELSGRRLSHRIRGALDLQGSNRRHEKTEESLRKLSCAVEQSADMVIITNLQGEIEYVNPAFEIVTGYSRMEVIGQNPRLLRSGEQTRAIYAELWHTVLSGGVYRGTLINRKKNGDVYYSEKTVSPVRDAQGQITHFISNDRDVTEKIKMEATLRQGQKMDAVGQLAGGIAHDFNNLLTVIGSYAELMLDTIREQNPLYHNIQQILKAKNRAADLTRQLLAFSRKQMQRLQVVDMNRSVGDVCRMLPRLIGEDIQVVFQPDDGAGKVKADPVQIEQIVMNLATNARDAMPNGGRLCIEVANVELDEAYRGMHSMVAPGRYVRLSVSDTGHGIAADKLPHIFEPFFTTKESGKGTGLGLATVYGIVKQNRGFVWVYSEVGYGTTFKIYWPQLRTDCIKPRPENTHESMPRGSEVILLVEDEEAVRESTAEFLQSCGYKILQAGNGLEAMNVARSFPGIIDLMLTDVIMPHMSGSESASRLLSLRPTMKVLFVSGYAEGRVLQNGVSQVRGAFLQKPFTLSQLGHKVREALQPECEAAKATYAGTSQ